VVDNFKYLKTPGVLYIRRANDLEVPARASSAETGRTGQTSRRIKWFDKTCQRVKYSLPCDMDASVGGKDSAKAAVQTGIRRLRLASMGSD